MIITLILFILILGITVLVHEFGHFIFAKMVGVHVYEFAIGMGPVLFKKKGKDGVQYSIRAIPIGGFVSLAGEEVEVDLEQNKGHNLQDKKVWQRFLVMFMGVGNNFIFAFLVLLLMGLIYGAPNLTPIIIDAPENYPAHIAGIDSGDKILSINNRKVRYTDDVSLFLILEGKDEPLTFKVEKQDKTIRTYEVVPEKQISKDGEESYVIGINLESEKERGIIKSIVYAFKQECAFFKQMFNTIGGLFTGDISVKQLSGPVGIYGVVGDAKDQGINSLLKLLALLSINVGIINLLPLPAFDGGRILFLIIEKIKGSPVSPKVENIIHSIGFILLIILMLYVTFNDILRLF